MNIVAALEQDRRNRALKQSESNRHDLSPYDMASKLLDQTQLELMGYRLRPEEVAALKVQLNTLRIILMTSEEDA
jgi:beta-lactamase class A